MTQEQNKSLSVYIAEQLGETDKKPRRQIAAIVEHCGVEFAETLLKDTLETEANGGMMLSDQSRRRTAGGVFFHLARGRMPKATAKVIFPNYFKPKPASERQPELPKFNWGNRLEILRPLVDEKGEASTVKITLIGRPGKIDLNNRDVVITAMTHAARNATLPKGVPQPPEKATLYTVYIAAKQWRRVEEPIANPEDMLIIEGTCAYDEKIGGMAVYAMSVTTKALEAKKRQDQKEKAGSPPVPTEPLSPVTPPPPVTVMPENANLPPDVAQKLNGLYASASLFRQKIATLQAKPTGQQSGLEMTQKLLKNVEDEIAALEKKYAD